MRIIFISKLLFKRRIIMSNPKTPLVADSRSALTKFKMECAAEIGRTQFTKENNDHYKGDLTSKQNGSEGGPIGGQMVKKMVEMYESNMK